MKKLIGTVVAAALLATAAFADITFGAWVRGVWAPVASQGDEGDLVSGLTNSWGGAARTARADITMSSEDGRAGLQLGVYEVANGKWEGVGDDVKLWAKPIEQVKVTFGHYNNTTLRGDMCYGSWNYLRVANAKVWGEGMTFSTNQQDGVLFEVTPMEGLYIFASLPQPFFDGNYKDAAAEYKDESTGKSTIDHNWKSKGAAWDQFEGMQAGFGYTIDGIGKAKVQWIGIDGKKTGTKRWETGAIEVGFDLTAVDGLFVTAGFRFDIYDKDLVGDHQKILLALGASYQVMDNLKLYADFAMMTFEVKDPGMNFGIGADYGLMDGLTLNVDFRGYMPNNDYDPVFSFLVGFNYSCGSNGCIGIGFQGVTGAEGQSDSALGYTYGYAGTDKMVWAIPVTLSVWF